MHEVVVLIPGHVVDAGAGRQGAAGTVAIARGEPNVLVDTGDPWQRDHLLAALAEQGLDPADVAYVVNTHGHLDHVSNNNLFPRATFVLGADVASGGEYWLHQFERGPLSIGGAGTGAAVTVLLTPGHTDHDLSVIVPTSAGTVAIVGDLFEYEADERDGAWRRWSQDPERQQASRETIRQLADWVVPGHGGMFRVVRPPAAEGR